MMLPSVTSRASPNLLPIIADRRTVGQSRFGTRISESDRSSKRCADIRGPVPGSVDRYSRIGPRIGARMLGGIRWRRFRSGNCVMCLAELTALKVAFGNEKLKTNAMALCCCNDNHVAVLDVL